MSVRVMSAVFERYASGGGEMLLALALADVSRDDGVLMLNDSVPVLAQKTRQTERGVQVQLRRMQATGWLILVRGTDGGRGRVCTYRISPQWLAGQDLRPMAVDVAGDPPPETPNAATRNPEARSGFAKPETPNAATENPEPRSGAYRPTRPNTLIPPNPPLGGKPKPSKSKAKPKPERKASEATTLLQWLLRCKADGVMPIPPDDPVQAYCARVGIGDDILALHWAEFKLRRSEGTKRQADWRRTFRNSVRDNWYRLWFIGAGQPAQLTTTGRQAQASHAILAQPT